MKAFLMYEKQDFDLQRPLPANEQALTQDLELNTLFNAMALGDDFLFEVARKAILSGSTDLDTIRYRQSILQDCLKNSAIVRDIYRIPLEAIANKRKHWWGIFSRYPSGILSGAMDLLQMFIGLLKKLKHIATEHADKFESAGFTKFFTMIKEELDDDYFTIVQKHLSELKFSDGVLLSAALGKGNEGADYILRKSHDNNQSWMERIFAQKPPVYSFRIHPRDEAGSRALSELKDRGINLVANALAQSADHIDSFLHMLRIELAFYIGCLNLYEQLTQMGAPTFFPVPVAADERRHTFQGLYDACLALTMKRKIVGNDVTADHKDLVIITGANQGGKSTFLRSIGLSQLMMQCGMFVPAESFCANVCDGLFSHFRREEGVTMESGKLDEELSRMSDIANKITSNSMLVFNESFASTNEREGSEIAGQIVSALLEKRIKVFFVTHLYEFAHGFYARSMENAMFLRAERKVDGRRTFKLIEGEPSQTSYGADLYKRVFGADD
ncbi:MAG: hypothetical protein M5U01_35855 [Ardenticatenaceae bacterium]|nr:hypothetical protein [Ardenticatenaceae bacterium]HBY97192.1 DNA mismatch repair protein MutS [Chloroflexota bacterium]